MDVYENYRLYRKARRTFAIKTYLILFFWLFLALAQWLIICFVANIGIIFVTHYYIGYITFFLSVLIFAFFIFFEVLRFIKVLNFILSFIIVELQIISLFPVVARCFWVELLVFYAICFVILWLFILIGTFLPKKVDFTLDVAILFIVGFLFLIIAVFFLIIRFVVFRQQSYTYIIVEIAINIIILFFVMYHAQTIHGSRFAEMRLNDALLGSLILFHDFLIIYWLTFYWQILVRPLTPESEILWESTQTGSGNTKSYNDDDTGEKKDSGQRKSLDTASESDVAGVKDKGGVEKGESQDTIQARGRPRAPPRSGGFTLGEVDAARYPTIDTEEYQGEEITEISGGVNREKDAVSENRRYTSGGFGSIDNSGDSGEASRENYVSSPDNIDSVSEADATEGKFETGIQENNASSEDTSESADVLREVGDSLGGVNKGEDANRLAVTVEEEAR